MLVAGSPAELPAAARRGSSAGSAAPNSAAAAGPRPAANSAGDLRLPPARLPLAPASGTAFRSAGSTRLAPAAPRRLLRGFAGLLRAAGFLGRQFGGNGRRFRRGFFLAAQSFARAVTRRLASRQVPPPASSWSTQSWNRRVGRVEHCQQRRRGELLLLQPLVERLLDRPGRFAQIGQADHAAAALEGMEAAPQRGQRLAIVRLAGELRQVGGDGGQHLVGFLEEDRRAVRHRLRRCWLRPGAGSRPTARPARLSRWRPRQRPRWPPASARSRWRRWRRWPAPRARWSATRWASSRRDFEVLLEFLAQFALGFQRRGLQLGGEYLRSASAPC